jgi:hypothetical protein
MPFEYVRLCPAGKAGSGSCRWIVNTEVFKQRINVGTGYLLYGHVDWVEGKVLMLCFSMWVLMVAITVL